MLQLSNIVYRLRHSTFFVNFATLSTGTIIAQIIPFAATIILSRLYSPDEMGEWGVFSSYGAILAIVGCFRYEGAIVNAKSQSDAYQLTYISIILSLIFVLVLYVIAFILKLTGINMGMNLSAIIMLPIYIFTLLQVQSLTNLSTYLREYKLIATNTINRSVSQTVSRILLGGVKTNRQGMIVGAIIGNIISLFTLGRSIGILKNTNSFHRLRSLELIKEYKYFPLYDLPSSLLNTVSSYCPAILLSWFFQEAVVGFFSMAHNLLYIPMSFIGSAVSQLFYRDASENIHNGKSITSLTKRLFISLYFMASIFMCLLILCEGWLFGVILGSRWNDVGHYVVLLSPWLLLVTALSPLSTIFYVKGKQKVNMNLNIMGVIIRVASIAVVALLFHSGFLTIFSFGLSSFIFQLVQGYFILKYGKVFFTTKDIMLLSVTSIAFVAVYIWKLVFVLI